MSWFTDLFSKKKTKDEVINRSPDTGLPVVMHTMSRYRSGNTKCQSPGAFGKPKGPFDRRATVVQAQEPDEKEYHRKERNKRRNGK